MILAFLSLLGFLFSYNFAYAHEAYVLPANTFWQSIKGPISGHALDALKNPHDLNLTLIIAFFITVLLIASIFWGRSQLGTKIRAKLEQYSYVGPHLIRATLAIALFFSAVTNTFLGPELASSAFPYAYAVRILLFALSIMFALGFLTELAGLIGIIIFIGSAFIFGPYVLTYLNYLGEFIVLFLFGMRYFSVDKYIFGRPSRFKNLAKYESLIIRVFYGAALIYAAITVKLLHPDLTILVVNTWHLTQFHWLFPSDPLLITLGAGIVEIVIGLFIIFGFEMRLTILISLFYITLSLFFFREMVWPHLMLYGISLYLLLQPEVLAVDNLLIKYRAIIKKL